jgi:putative sigma-54 modulation protein
MKVHFTGRHVDVSEALKATAQERLDKMTTYLDDVIDAHVIITVEKHRHTAEITLKTRRDTFVASAETEDMYKSLAEASDKLETQAHKAHGKKMARIQGGGKEVLVEAEAEG